MRDGYETYPVIDARATDVDHHGRRVPGEL
jgi:hypothetical protein